MNADELRSLIGRPVRLRGELHVVVEILDAESAQPSLVLRSGEACIQPDQWGDAHRRVPATVTLQLYAENGELNPELQQLWAQDT